MAAPTYVNQYATAFNSATSPKTAMSAVAINAGDVIIGLACHEGTSVPALTENGSASWVAQQTISITDYCAILCQSYTCTGSENLTVTSTLAVSWFGANAVRFSATDGVGASNKANAATGSPSVSLTTTQANSAIVAICGDWNAINADQTFTLGGSSSGWVGLTGFRGDATHYGVAIAYHPDAGAIGSKTIGMSSPTGQKWSIVAIEVKGTASAAATSLVIPPRAAIQSILAR